MPESCLCEPGQGRVAVALQRPDLGTTPSAVPLEDSGHGEAGTG